MESKNETVDDVVREMRIFKCRNLLNGTLEPCLCIQDYFSDRIEAAHKREIAAKDADIASLRELVKELETALESCIHGLEIIYAEECTGYGTIPAYYKAKEILAKAKKVVK